MSNWSKFRYFLYGITLATEVFFGWNSFNQPDYIYVLQKQKGSSEIRTIINNRPIEENYFNLTFEGIFQQKDKKGFNTTSKQGQKILTVQESLPTIYLDEKSPISRLEIRINK